VPPIVSAEVAELAVLKRLAAYRSLRPKTGSRTSPLGIAYRLALVRLLIAGAVESRGGRGQYRLTDAGRARLAAATDSARGGAA
jgi:hypothetical protein